MQYLTRKISEYRYKTPVPKYRNRRPRHQIPSSETKGPEANTSRRTEPVERLIGLEQFRRIRTSGSALVSLVMSEIWVFFFILSLQSVSVSANRVGLRVELKKENHHLR
ncbi:hypothetical protein CIPAW_13G047800 [Carya illinoinensis]|uniref:Uncharacterized protein n=1 Tax=Carya illinoinensis TaxID=32201 RepID=A0A8T1NPM5_CARIL|nr:hypothetical protein CIPAW_13G047800 [Carya illinoinensis]